MAQRLGLTTSAVRVHMTALERQRVVRRGGVVRGRSRPAALFELAPDADALLSRAYVPFVATLLRTLDDALAPQQVVALMQQAGRRLASDVGERGGSVGERVRAACAILNELGARTEVEDAGRGLAIAGADCPLAAAVRASPAVCRAMESFVAGIVQTRVRESCDRAGRARCRFEIVTPA